MHKHLHAYILSPTCLRTPAPLTLAHVLVLFEAWFAHTPPDGNQPSAVCTAVHLGRLKLLRGVHTHTVHLNQCRFSTRYCVRKLGQIQHSEWTFLVEDPHGDQSNAGAQVLEGQVETLFTQVVDGPHFRV